MNISTVYRFIGLFSNNLYHQNPMMSSELKRVRTWVITGRVLPSNICMSSNECAALHIEIHGLYGVQNHRHHLSVQRPLTDPHQSYLQPLPLFFPPSFGGHIFQAAVFHASFLLQMLVTHHVLLDNIPLFSLPASTVENDPETSAAKTPLFE